MRKLLLLLLLLIPLRLDAARLFVRTNSDTVIVPGNSAIVTGSHSYSWWMRPASTPGSGTSQRIYSDGSGTGNIGIAISYENVAAESFAVVTANAFSTYTIKIFNTTLTTGNWYHCAVLIDPSLDDTNEVKFYLNGSALTLTSSTASWNTNVSFYGTAGIGCLRWGPPNADFFDGSLSQFMWISGGILNTAEITALSRGANFYGIRPPTSYGKAYPIDGLSGTESDISPNHAHSTSISGTSKTTGPPTVPR